MARLFGWKVHAGAISVEVAHFPSTWVVLAWIYQPPNKASRSVFGFLPLRQRRKYRSNISSYFKSHLYFFSGKLRICVFACRVLHFLIFKSSLYMNWLFVLWLHVVFKLQKIFIWKTYQSWDFPCGALVKNPPANTGDTGLIPGLGGSHMPWNNYAHAPQLLSLCSRAHAPQLLKATGLGPVLHNKRRRCSEKPTHATKSSPRLPQLEKARAQQRRPNAAKNK